MKRTILLVLAVPVAWLAGAGCLSDSTASLPDDLVLTAWADREEAAKDETVELTATLTPDNWAQRVTYLWFQTSGRAVELKPQEEPDAVSFAVPSLPAAQTLRFRVYVQGPDGTVYSDMSADSGSVVEVLALADPDYEPSGSSGGGGTGTSNDITEEQALADEQVELDKTDAERQQEFADLVSNGQDAAGNRLRETSSGLQYVAVTRGSGDLPEPSDTVRVHYAGFLFDTGSLFDSSIERGTPSQFALDGVIAGWTEGLQLMPVGSYYRFVIPADLAYGETGSGTIPGNATLVFDVYLLEIVQ